MEDLPEIVVGHIYRTRRNAFWRVTTADTCRGNTWVVPCKGDPRTLEWHERAMSNDISISCLAYATMTCKPTNVVLDSIVEDITSEVLEASLMFHGLRK